jgi:hypothetical protein
MRGRCSFLSSEHTQVYFKHWTRELIVSRARRGLKYTLDMVANWKLCHSRKILSVLKLDGKEIISPWHCDSVWLLILYLGSDSRSAEEIVDDSDAIAIMCDMRCKMPSHHIFFVLPLFSRSVTFVDLLTSQ